MKTISAIFLLLLMSMNIFAQVEKDYRTVVDSLVWEQIYRNAINVRGQAEVLHAKYQDIDELRWEYAFLHNANMKKMVSGIADKIALQIKNDDDLQDLKEFYEKQQIELDIVGSLEFQKIFQNRIITKMLDVVEKSKTLDNMMLTKYEILDKEFEKAFEDYWKESDKGNYETLFQVIEEGIIEKITNIVGDKMWLNKFMASFKEVYPNYLCITLMEFCTTEDLKQWIEMHSNSPLGKIADVSAPLQDYLQTSLSDLKGFQTELLRVAQNATPIELAEYAAKTRSRIKMKIEKKVRTATISWEKGTYSGEIFNTLPHGKGIYTDKKGVIYNGTWKDGKRHGYITQTKKGKSIEKLWADDKIVKAKINVKGDFSGYLYKGKPFGKGTLYKTPDVVEIGTFIDGKLHGEGIKKFEEQEFEGIFDNGSLVNGSIKIKGNNRSKIVANGELDMSGTGNGMVIIADMEKTIRIEGTFFNFVPDGVCEFIKKQEEDSCFYHGNMAYGQSVGRGTIKAYFSDGYLEYKGLFYDNDPCGGEAVSNVLKDGTIYHYVGEYNGDFNGLGKLLMIENGDTIVYEGSFKNGLFDGIGKYSSSDFTYEGGWKSGIINGVGVAVNNQGEIYDGEWRNGTPWGEGKIIMKNKQMLTGFMTNGKMVGVLKNSQGRIIRKSHIAGFTYHYKYLKK